MPKLAAAIITGTMARPSSPSVRFTALPAPTMMNIANSDEEPAEIEHEFLEERKHQRHRDLHLPELDQRETGKPGDDGFEHEPRAAGKSVCDDCLVTFR